MPLKPILTRTTDEQVQALADYCRTHKINKQQAGRIAFARLLERKPKPAEIEAATVSRDASLANLRQYQDTEGD